MATITFYADSGLGGAFDIDLGGSGLGFYGAGGFGSSVAVGSYQDNTYVTNAVGTLNGGNANNVKWTHSGSGDLGSNNLLLRHIPNVQATLKIGFAHTSAIQVQNAELRIYNGSDIDLGADGVTTKAAELIHVNPADGVPLGSGDTTWSTPSGTYQPLGLAQSPGESGLYAGNGTTSVHASVLHNWYVALSARPDTIGSKTDYSMYFSCEYL